MFFLYSIASSHVLVLLSTEVMVKWRTASIAPDIFYLNTEWKWVVSFTPGSHYPQEPLNMSLAGVRRPALNGWILRVVLF